MVSLLKLIMAMDLQRDIHMRKSFSSVLEMSSKRTKHTSLDQQDGQPDLMYILKFIRMAGWLTLRRT